MPTPPIADEVLSHDVSVFLKCQRNLTQAAEVIGIARQTLQSRLQMARIRGILKNDSRDPGPAPGRSTFAPAEPKFDTSGSDDSFNIDSVSPTIKTVEDALRHAEVDENIWEVKDYHVKSWQVAMKLETPTYMPRTRPKRKPDEPDVLIKVHAPRVQTLFGVKVQLRRKVAKHVEDALAKLLERIEAFAPKYPKLVRPKLKGTPYMLEVALFDAHFGRLALAEETGCEQNLDVTAAVYENAVQDIIDKASPYSISRIILPFGQDFLHIDNSYNTTARGTIQDVSSRLWKIVDVAVLSFRKAIDRLVQIAPVHIPFVPGNHDLNLSYLVARELQAWYHNHPEVTFDLAPTTRKIVVHGKNGIMFAHGDEEPMRDLPITMAAEERELWGKIQYAEVHCGHFHKKKIVSFVSADTFGGGVVVRYIPSLSGSDAWHYRKGYNRTARAAEAYLWGEEPGIAAYLNAPARAA
jgi:hypothetical protein